MAAAPDIFNRTWDLALLTECFQGASRFDQLQSRLGISRKTLAERLRSLVEDGVLVRSQYQTRPDRFEYWLTRKGQELFPIVMAIRSWGERWGGNGWPVEHVPCRHQCAATVICDHCADPVRLDDVRIGSDTGTLTQPRRSP